MEHFGERLRSARKMSGLSMEALAQKAGGIVSKQAISKYEKGDTMPGSTVLLRLASALGVKVDYFFRPVDATIKGLEFREKASLKKKTEAQIHYLVRDFVAKSLEVGELLQLDASFTNPLAGRNRIETSQDIERVADELRDAWQLGRRPIAGLIEMLEENGFKIFDVALPEAEKFDGLSGWVAEGSIPVIAVYAHGDIARKRFTTAHELAHLLLDFSAFSDEKEIEGKCHDFAGALLFPQEQMEAEFVRERKKITLWELKRLKGIYGISMQAIMMRARRLGIISATSHKHFCIQANKLGFRANEPKSYPDDGRERANRFKQLVFTALTEEIISYSKAAELLGISLQELEDDVEIIA